MHMSNVEDISLTENRRDCSYQMNLNSLVYIILEKEAVCFIRFKILSNAAIGDFMRKLTDNLKI